MGDSWLITRSSWTGLVLVLFLALSLVSAGQSFNKNREADAPDPCQFPGNHKENTLWIGPLASIQRCFDSIKLLNSDRTRTTAALQSVLQLYSFTDLVANSGGIYNISVNLNHMIHEFSAKAYKSDYAFQMDIVNGMAQLFDAHTVYLAAAGYRQFYTLTPFMLTSGVDNSGKQVMRLIQNTAINNGTYAKFLKLHHNVTGINIQQYYNRAIYQINGQDPMEFIKGQLDRLGLFKDLSVRFNHMLKGNFLMGLISAGTYSLGPLSYKLLLEGEKHSIEFYNFGFSTPVANTSALKAKNSAPPLMKPIKGKRDIDDYKTARKVLPGSFEADWSALRAAADKIAPKYLKSLPLRHPQDLPLGVLQHEISQHWATLLATDDAPKADPEPKADPREVQGHAEPTKKQITVKRSTVTVNAVQTGDTANFQSIGGVPRSIGYLSYKNTTVLKVQSFNDNGNEQNWIDTVNAIVKQRRDRSLSNNLIVDVTGNGGGDLCLNYYLLSWLVHDWSGAKLTSNAILYEPYDMRRTNETNELFRAGYLNGSRILSPSSRNPYSNNDQWYTGGVTLNRGGYPCQYTTRFLWNACDLGGPDGIDALPKASEFFDKIIVISDGRCSSACAYFISKLRKDNKVRVLTLGGLVSEPDTIEAGSAAGGNSIVWEEFLRDLRSDGIQTTYSPLPNSAILGFTFREVYIGSDLDDKLGGSSLSLNTLPREFNKLTADWHIFYWGTLQPSTAWTSQEFANVYETALTYFDHMPSGLPGEVFWTPAVMAVIISCAILFVILLVVLFIMSWQRSRSITARAQLMQPKTSIYEEEDGYDGLISRPTTTDSTDDRNSRTTDE